MTRFPGPVPGACFGLPASPRARPLAPPAPPGLTPHCSSASRLSGRRRRPEGLASVRRSNGPYGFPVSRFHKGVSTKVQGRNQRDQAYQPVLVDQLALRQLFPASVAPALVTMRPKPPHDPAVKLVEELADVGLTVILAPTPNDRVDLIDQLLRADRSFAPGTLANLVFKVPDGFRARNSIARSPANPALDLRGLQPERPPGRSSLWRWARCLGAPLARGARRHAPPALLDSESPLVSVRRMIGICT